jgi:hypothetical protein
MDIEKYINENLDDILNNKEEYIKEQKENKNIIKQKKHISWKDEIEENSNIMEKINEDETTIEDIQNELFEEQYNRKLDKEYLKSLGEYYSDSDDENENIEDKKEKLISEHKLNLLNLFLMHYNEKYEKCENYFSNIKNIEKDTTQPMELFFEALVEFKKVKETLKTEDEECMNYYYEDTEDENIDKMTKEFPEGQLYCLDYINKRIISPSILICLNYIINNKANLYENKGWCIFNLRDN